MKNGRLQAKDIPDELILNFLAKHQGRWATWGDGYGVMPSVNEVVGNFPYKVVLAKMSSLIRRDLSGGCDCGCRGDYEITDKGLALINHPRTKPYSGY